MCWKIGIWVVRPLRFGLCGRGGGWFAVFGGIFSAPTVTAVEDMNTVRGLESATLEPFDFAGAAQTVSDVYSKLS